MASQKPTSVLITLCGSKCGGCLCFLPSQCYVSGNSIRLNIYPNLIFSETASNVIVFPFSKYQSQSSVPCENSEAMVRDKPYRGRQMGLSIVDRHFDSGFQLYLPSLHRMEIQTDCIFKATKRPATHGTLTDRVAVFLITSVPPRPWDDARRGACQLGTPHRCALSSPTQGSKDER